MGMYAKYKLNTVERYYSFMSQGNSFAPKFKDLREDVQAKWTAEFNEYTKRGNR